VYLFFIRNYTNYIRFSILFRNCSPFEGVDGVAAGSFLKAMGREESLIYQWEKIHHHKHISRILGFWDKQKIFGNS